MKTNRIRRRLPGAGMRFLVGDLGATVVLPVGAWTRRSVLVSSDGCDRLTDRGLCGPALGTLGLLVDWQLWRGSTGGRDARLWWQGRRGHGTRLLLWLLWCGLV